MDVENGIDNTISGPATDFQVDPTVAARLGFTPVEVAEDATSILDGVTTTDPLIANGRPYTSACDWETRRASRWTPSRILYSIAPLASGDSGLAGAGRHNCLRRTRYSAKTCSSYHGNRQARRLRPGHRDQPRCSAPCDAMHLPPTVRVEYGGTYQEQQQSFRELLQVLVLSLALVFGALLAEFRNFSAPIAILTSSVLSIAGVVFALLITGTTFNVASFMGLIMVIGIVAKNGILLLDADERYRREGVSAREAMVHASQRRLRPILMTAAAAICGMLPLAFALGSGSQMLQPLAIAVIGGLVISMVLSLIVTPVVYYLLTRSTREAT